MKVPQSQSEPLSTVRPETTASEAELTEETPELLQELTENTQKKKTKNKSTIKEVNSSGTFSDIKRTDQEQDLKKEKQSENENKGSQTEQEKSTHITVWEQKKMKYKTFTQSVESHRALEILPRSEEKTHKKQGEEKHLDNKKEPNKDKYQKETEHTAHLPEKKKSKKGFVEADNSTATCQLSEAKRTAHEQSEDKVEEGKNQEHHVELENATQSEQREKKEKRKTFEVVDRAAEKDSKNQTDGKTPSKKRKGIKTEVAPEEETPAKPRKKTKKKNVSESGPEGEPELEQALTKKKKKRAISVEFEYEADTIQAAADDGEETAGVQLDTGTEIPQTSFGTKTFLKKKKAESAFVSFQNNASPPPALLCRTKGQSTSLSSKMKCVTPKSDSKKVRFGLRNNKTTEFRETDRSLLVSPDGSSRVAFDPEQKPRCGVLKSPFTHLRKIKKTPANPMSRQKRTSFGARPTAADFF